LYFLSVSFSRIARRLALSGLRRSHLTTCVIIANLTRYVKRFWAIYPIPNLAPDFRPFLRRFPNIHTRP